MDVLQCNIIQQFVFILEGLIPQHKEEVVKEAASVHESVDGWTTVKLENTVIDFNLNSR